MGGEVHVLEPVGGDVRVDLRRGDVGVAEHFLHRAQVASAGEQVGGGGGPAGEAVAVGERHLHHLADHGGRDGQGEVGDPGRDQLLAREVALV